MAYCRLARYMSELFSTRLRYSDASLKFQVGGAISGGLTPLVAALLISWEGNATCPVSCLLIGTALVTLIVEWKAREKADAKLID